MKNFVIAVFVALISIQVSAQDYQYNQQMDNSLNRFYVDLVSKAATLNGDWGLFGGIKAGYNLNKNISLGAAGHGLIPNKLGGSYINKENRDELHLGYGGVDAAYKYYLSDKSYLSGILMLGAGRIDYENLDGYDYFFIMEPGISYNYKITDWFGLGYSINYRFTSGVKYADFSNASFSGWSTDLSFKFGF